MLDLLIKILPIFLALVPFFVWLDKSKRFTHRRKFYLNRLDAIKEYIDNYYDTDKEKIEKDCAAQALVCSEKISHLEVDYLIKEFPQHFFIMIKKLITARHFIDTEYVDDQIMLTAKSSKKSYKKKRFLLACIYLSSFIIIFLNNISVFIIKKLEWFSPIVVDQWLLLLGEAITLICGAFIALISGIIFYELDAAIEIYDDLKVKHNPSGD